MKFKNLLLGVLVVSGACVASSVAMSSSFERIPVNWSEHYAGLNANLAINLFRRWKEANNRFLTGFELTDEFLENPLFIAQLVKMTYKPEFVAEANNMLGEWLGTAIICDVPWNLELAYELAQDPAANVAEASFKCLQGLCENEQKKFDRALDQAGAKATSSAGASPVAQPKVHKRGLMPRCLADN